MELEYFKSLLLREPFAISFSILHPYFLDLFIGFSYLRRKFYMSGNTNNRIVRGIARYTAILIKFTFLVRNQTLINLSIAYSISICKQTIVGNRSEITCKRTLTRYDCYDWGWTFNRRVICIIICRLKNKLSIDLFKWRAVEQFIIVLPLLPK